MASQTMECHRAGAEVFTGDATCRKMSVELLEELGLPKGLLPLEDIQEFGYNRNSGFIWLVQGKKVEHTFKKIMQKVSYDAAFIENGKLRKITGIKTNAMMLWIRKPSMPLPLLLGNEGSPNEAENYGDVKSSAGLMLKTAMLHDLI
ncbi:unnamed protein product [Miscanthus lutarioriparius]|uniref:Uncharacterized protein n=1 Tax=Miscanthus lutarioriparius TaxID=422564 RepID=A0A811NSB1_9POAL|nr:unnamed protein product [Miscanthus lutarioriparius]